MQPADDGGRRGKRLTRDPRFRTRVAVAEKYQIPLSEFSDWAPDDQGVALGSQLYKAECCSDCGVHPAEWDPRLGGDFNAVVPVWKHCRVCELIGLAREAGPPDPDTKHGWHLTLKHNHPKE